MKKTAVRKSVVKPKNQNRMSTGNLYDYPTPENNPPDEDYDFVSANGEENVSVTDTQSFKSFAIDANSQETGSIVSSIHESEFEDAIDEKDYWLLNKSEQHFSLIPVLTINSFKNISKSVQKQYDKVLMYSSISSRGKHEHHMNESTENDTKFNFQFSHHFISEEIFEEYAEDSDSSSDEMEIKMDLDNDYNDFSPKQEEINNAIEIKIDIENHSLKKSNKTVSIVWAEMKTQNIFLEITPSTIIHS